ENADSFLDDNLEPGTVYAYRVKAVNGVGETNYSQVVSGTTLIETVTKVDPSDLSLLIGVYPNPFTTDFTLNISNEYQGPLNIEITGLTGERVYYNKVNKQSAVEELNINVEGIKSGVYFVTLSGDQFSITQKLIKKP